MPTENEVKFPLSIYAEEEIASLTTTGRHISQGYIHSSPESTTRIRKEEWRENGVLKQKFTFCFKRMTASRLIEIENEISEVDFNDLWESCCLQRVTKIGSAVYREGTLEKVRYALNFHSNSGDIAKWEIDFLKQNGVTYFALAEHEMPENQLEPKFVPDIINKYLIGRTRDPQKLANYKLTDIAYAKELYKELNNETKSIT